MPLQQLVSSATCKAALTCLPPRLSSSPSALPTPEEEGTALFDLNLSRAGKPDMLNPEMELTAPGKHACPLGDPSPESSSELETAVLPREL